MPLTRTTTAELVWTGDLTFTAQLSKSSIVLDSTGVAGPSPVETLAASIAGCMAMDVVHILTRGRHQLRALNASLEADRTEGEPRRITFVRLHLTVAGSAPSEAVARAIELSRTRYCSVWHSIRQDVDLQVTFDLIA